jgi:hypothetical protein
MIRINNASPILLMLVLLIIIIVTKFTKLSIILILFGLLLLLCHHFKIVHMNQITSYLENFIDFFMSNENPLDINKKLETFKNSLDEDDKIEREIPKDVIYSQIPVLVEYEKLQDNILTFIENLRDEDKNDAILSKDSYKMNINKNIAYIYYYAYSTLNDKYYPQQNFTTCLEYQKKLLNSIHSFIYLDVSPLYDTEMNKLLEDTIKINKKLNDYIVDKINVKYELNDDNNNLYFYSNQLTSPDEPEPYNNIDELRDFF